MLVQKYREARGDGRGRWRSREDQPGDRLQPLAAQQEGPHRGVRRLRVRRPDVEEEWRRFVAARRDEELERIIADEGLNPEETREFVERAFRDGAIQTTGTAITRILPPTSRFAADDSHGIKKQTVLDRLAAFFDRYFVLG